MNNYCSYNIYNQNSMLNYGHKSVNDYQHYHIEQQKNILEMRKAIRDYCESARKVSAEYRQIAMEQCIQEIVIQASTR